MWSCEADLGLCRIGQRQARGEILANQVITFVMILKRRETLSEVKQEQGLKIRETGIG